MNHSPTHPAEVDEWHPIYNPFGKTVTVSEDSSSPASAWKLFLTPPLYSPLLFPNVSSDARDHCANERTFLSWLRLAVYMAVVAVAILINFHLKHRPTELEIRISFPLGLIFWLLSLACLANGFGLYVRTVTKYARRQALVQSGVKTQVVFGVVATAIIAACAVFLGAEALATKNPSVPSRQNMSQLVT